MSRFLTHADTLFQEFRELWLPIVCAEWYQRKIVATMHVAGKEVAPAVTHCYRFGHFLTRHDKLVGLPFEPYGIGRMENLVRTCHLKTDNILITADTVARRVYRYPCRAILKFVALIMW